MKYHSAPVTITGKVFVSEADMNERLREKFPQYKDSEDPTMDCTYAEEIEAFEELAKEKLAGLFPTHDPFKHNESLLDMASYC